MQGCGVGVETGVGVGRSRPFWSESEMESVKFCRLQLRLVVAGYHPSTDDNFDQTVMHHMENIEREGKKGGCVEIMLERHLAIEFGLKRVSEIILGSSR